MRIAYVTRQLPPVGVGGIGTYVLVVARAMAAAGHDVTVISAGPGATRNTVWDGVVRIERFPEIGPDWVWHRAARVSDLLARRVRGAMSALRALRSLGEDFDVVEAPEWNAEALLLRFARRGVVVVHLHLSLELMHAWNRSRIGVGARLAQLLELWSARAGAARTATSCQTVTRPDGSTWLPLDDVDIVAPPVAVEPWCRCPDISTTAPLILFLGHLEERKQPDLVVQAAARLVADIPEVEVILCGRVMRSRTGVPYDQVVSRLAAEAGLSCSIVEPSPDPEAVMALLGRARVVVAPSRFETLSMVVFEALASGRPAVMTESVGAAEWVGPTLPQLVVSGDDPDALACALRPFLVDVTAAAAAGAAGRELVRRIGAPEAIVGSRLAVYRRVVA